jgi:sec-independent protein translocase protein TatA
MRLGWPEIILILAIVLIVFGVGKLPQVGAQLGKGIREFRKAAKGDLDETDAEAKPANSSKQ